MNTDEYSTEMELYGVSPGVIAIVMFLVTFFAPSGFLPSGGYFGPDLDGSIFYSLIWVYEFGGSYTFGFRVLFANLMLTLPLCILNVAFAVWIVRCYQGKSSKYSAVIIGLLSVLLPTLLVLYVSGLVIVIYPIPIQFIVGLLILWRIEGPEVISPWSGMRLNLSYWKWRRAKRMSDWDPFEDEKAASEKKEKLEAE